MEQAHALERLDLAAAVFHNSHTARTPHEECAAGALPENTSHKTRTEPKEAPLGK